MRKIILFALAFGIAGFAQARPWGARETSNVMVNHVIADNIASTATILIDLSDTSNYPHNYTGSIDISFLKISVDKVDIATGSVKVGVITEISAVDATGYFFADLAFSTANVSAHIEKTFNVTPSTIRTLIKGTTPFYFVTDDIFEADSQFQNDVLIPTAAGGNANAGKGDIVVVVGARNAAQATISIQALYRSNR